MMRPVGVFLCMLLAVSNALSTRHITPHHKGEVVVRLAPGANPDLIAKQHGYTNVGPVDLFSQHYRFQKVQNTMAEHDDHIALKEICFDLHSELSEHVDVHWLEPQVYRMHAKRALTPADPRWSAQWHLHSSDISTSQVNVQPVWNQNILGHDVTVCIVDDGLQFTHPDLSPNYRANASYDINHDDPYPEPNLHFDDHGTSAAGVAAARDNDVCGVGAAPRAFLSAVQLISAGTTDVQEAEGLSYKMELNDIYSCSWGPNDDGRRLDGPGPLTKQTFVETTRNGRGGRGNIYVWAGGNGRSSGDNCNYDGYANSRYVITVGAIDSSGLQPWYSEDCANLLVAAPSSGHTHMITTTDLLGAPGGSTTDCTDRFGGTSAAAPLTAGVIALILNANRNLGWRDVQHVLVLSAKSVDATDADWKVTGAGHHFNHKYGFGLIDVEAAVRLAKTWQNIPETTPIISTSSALSLSIPSNTPLEVRTLVTRNIKVEAVEVSVEISHNYRGEITLSLVSPSGTVSRLAERHNDSGRDINWTFTTKASWGEDSQGDWTLQVFDARENSNVGVLNGWTLRIFGHE